MYSFISYPLDIIKTNRILGTSLSKEGGETIPKEFVVLFEKGGFQHGLMRGISMTACLGVIAHQSQEFTKGNILLTAPVVTVLQNPFNVL